MNESEFRERLAQMGLELDEGNVIGGPFIPDGTYRVYDPDTHGVVDCNRDLEALIQGFNFYSGIN